MGRRTGPGGAPVAGPHSPAATHQPAGGSAYPAPGPGPGPAPAPAPSGMIDQLERLGQLRASGVLTDAEFEAQKYRVLAG